MWLYVNEKKEQCREFIVTRKNQAQSVSEHKCKPNIGKEDETTLWTTAREGAEPICRRY